MAAYGFIGVVHLATPDAFLPIMPDWVPEPRRVVIVTGLCELAGVLGLAWAPARRWAGIGLALYAVCVFPANLKHAFEGITVPGLPDSWWYHAPRLAFQPVFVWWALYAAGIIDWPWRARSGR
ncbi:DoxX family protein [Methylobacterium sp. J-068]|nr:DoxX family protein [Methylobacterium sp. J-068]MCJ2035733.1 DoxX family protein [Methylobacterium sp. J-068]